MWRASPNLCRQPSPTAAMTAETEHNPLASPLGLVTWPEMWRTWGRVACLSFGGPAGQIAVMHRLLVEEKRWVSDPQFLHALNFCMLLPGPEAQQLATYIGWQLRGVRGGLLAGGLFILPGFLSILLLSLVYAHLQGTELLATLFFGLKSAVLVIVLEAVLRISRKVLKTRPLVGVAVVAFLAIHFFQASFPLVILIAGGWGLLAARLAPHWFSDVGQASAPAGATAAEVQSGVATLEQSAPTWRWVVGVSAVALPLWFAPLLVIASCLGTDSVLFQQGTFFSKSALVTFGGAYSVLTYVAQQAVEHYHWLEGPEMLDGLGLAESTPGPLIMVVQFVGYLGAYHHPGPFSPIVAGILGSLITTWVTFVPCFYLVFLGAPFIERLRGNRQLAGVLTAITAAVVGAILNLALWFAIQTMFTASRDVSWGICRFTLPEWSTLDGSALAVTGLAAWLIFRRHASLPFVLLTCILAGGVLRLGF